MRFSEQAIDKKNLRDEIMNVIMNEDPFPTQTSKEEEEQNEEDGPSVPDDIRIQVKFILFDLQTSTFFKDFKDYRFWLTLAQKRMQASGNIEDGMDYIRNGLKELPLCPELLYNYACANESTGNFPTAVKFFAYAHQVRPRWCDALFGEAVSHFKMQDFKSAKRCIKRAIKSYKNDSKEKIEVMIYFQAMCYKNLRKYDKAKRDYGSLLAVYNRSEYGKILQHVTAMIILPLQKN